MRTNSLETIIAASSSNEYVPYLSVWLQSLIDYSNTKNNYKVYIFEKNITDFNKQKLLSQIKQGNISLNFLNPMEILNNYKLKFHANYALECYFRLVSPIMLSKYNKIIFTDVDLVFNDDPAKLYNVDISNNYLAACKDFIWQALLNHESSSKETINYCKNVLELKDPSDYYNTGVMLLNVKKFNENNCCKKLLDLVQKTHFKILEQDGLNKFFYGQIKSLDTNWNYTVPIKIYSEIIKGMPQKDYIQYKKDEEHPKVIHWAGAGKPWKNNLEPLANIWWQYARKTPFYEDILYLLYNEYNACKNINKVIRVKLFNLFVIYKKEIKSKKTKYSILGIPVWKTKNKGDVLRGYLFGFIPLLKSFGL